MNDEQELFEFKITVSFQKYYNEDNCWGIYEFYTEDDIPYYKTRTTVSGEQRKMGNLTGVMQQLYVGSEYIVQATYSEHPKYGHQYNPKSVYSIIPQSVGKQRAFLTTITSETIADSLLKAYPNLINDLISNKIDDIDCTQIKGVGNFTWQKIKQRILNNYLISDIMVMLKPLGVTVNMIKKLTEDIPNPALLRKQLEDNPYMLTRIQGLGFKKIDSLALKLHPEYICSENRLASFVNYYLNELGENEGHTWVSHAILEEAVANYVPECIDKFEWLLSNNQFLHIDNEKIGLKKCYVKEMAICKIIKERINNPYRLKLKDELIQKGIQKAQNDQGFTYMPEQYEVIMSSIRNPVSIITGQAGTGKTSITRAILNIFAEHGYTYTASALSAMAAKRITEASGHEGTTIHRTLGCLGPNKFFYNKDCRLLADIGFLDECSMINASIMYKWISAQKDNAYIILSGDHMQLPPIGYGNIFSDLLDIFNEDTVHKLTKPMRQAEMSGILSDARKVRINKNPIISISESKIIHGELNDMYYMFRNSRESLFNIAVKTYLASIKTDGIDNVAIIVPRKSDCINSTETINKKIQELLLGDVPYQIENVRMSFKLGAKVVQTKNDYDRKVFNGDIGYITDIWIDDDGKSHCNVKFQDSKQEEGYRIVEYKKKDLIYLDLAYALTCHKVQGSGFKTVIGIIDNTHYKLLDNCMLYTLMTRAKKRCLLLAEPQAFLQCIRTSHNSRNTWLALKEVN